MNNAREPTEANCLQFPGTSYQPYCAVVHIRKKRCPPCRSAANRAAAKRLVENRKQRNSNKLRVSAQLEAKLDQANCTMDNKTLEMAYIKSKIAEVEKLCDLYLEEKKKRSAK